MISLLCKIEILQINEKLRKAKEGKLSPFASPKPFFIKPLL